MPCRARQKEIETEVVHLLEDYNITDYPISIRRLSETLGIDLVSYSSLEPHERTLAGQVSSDAFSLSSESYGRATIVFNDRGSNYTRMRFSGGHEIAHIVLEHKEDSPESEAEADYFSGYLLAPHPLVWRAGINQDISGLFGVGGWCANYARDQTRARLREGGPWLEHEQWLIDYVQWKGGGLFGSA